MRPHTHTRRAAHAPASHLEPNRTSKPKSKLREARVCDIAQTAHAPRLLRAHGQEFAADAGHDTRHAQRRTLPRQPRRRRRRRIPVRIQTRGRKGTQTRDTQTQTRARAPPQAQTATATVTVTGHHKHNHGQGHTTATGRPSPEPRPYHNHMHLHRSRTWPGATQAIDVSGTCLRKSPDTRHAAATSTAVTHSAPLHPLRRRRSHC